MQIEKLTGLSEEKIKGADFTLLHVRFGFDRGAMKRMHEALAAAVLNPGFHCLPPVVEKKVLSIAHSPASRSYSLSHLHSCLDHRRYAYRPSSVVLSCRKTTQMISMSMSGDETDFV